MALFDPEAVEAVVEMTPPSIIVLLVVLSFLGSATFLTPLLVGGYLLKGSKRLLLWAGIVFGAYALRSALKALNSLSRPEVTPSLDPAAVPAIIRPLYAHPVEISTTAFPSGHMLAAVVFWGLFVLDTEIGRLRSRLVVAVIISGIVGASRIAVGAHYVGDVLGGFVFGLLYLGIMYQLINRVNRPILVAFGLPAVLSAVLLTVRTSTTGRVVLGLSIGVLVVWYFYTAGNSPPLAADPHPVYGVALIGVGLGTLLTVSGHPYNLVALGLVGGIVWLLTAEHLRLRKYSQAVARELS